MEDGAGGEREQALFGEAQPLQWSKVDRRLEGQRALQSPLQSVNFETMIHSANSIWPAGRRMGSTAPADRLAQELTGSDRGEFADQAMRLLSKVLARHEKMNPGPPIVVPGHLVIEAEQFRAIADQRSGMSKLGGRRVQPGPDDLDIEAAR